MLLLLLAGCGCPSFADIEVNDRQGATNDLERFQVFAAIDRFASWTGREGVCVARIEMRRDPTILTGQGFQDVGGQYHGRWIEVSADGDVFGTTVHELCHALDLSEGLRERAPALFPASDVPESSKYPTTWLREAESFARACDDGPASDPLFGAVAAACGGLGGSRAAWLGEHVFGAAEPDFEVAPGRFSLAYTEHHAVGLGPGDWVLDTELVNGRWWWVTLMGEAPWENVLVEVDLETGQSLRRIPLGATGIREVRLLHGDRLIVMAVAFEEEPARLVEVDPDTGALTELPVPPGVVSIQIGAVVGEELVVPVDREDTFQLERWDLRSGEVLDHDDGWVDELWRVGDRLEGAWYGGAQYSAYDGEDWTVTEVPAALSIVLPMANRSWLAVDATGGSPRYFRQIDGAWQLSEDPCVEAAWMYAPVELPDGSVLALLGIEADAEGRVQWARFELGEG